MIAAYKKKSNTAALIFVIGVVISVAVQKLASGGLVTALLTLCGWVSAVAFICSCWFYLKAKGRSGWWMLLLSITIVGLICFALMKDLAKDGSQPRPDDAAKKTANWKIAMVTVGILGALGLLANVSVTAYLDGQIWDKTRGAASIGDQATKAVEDFMAKNNAFPILIGQTGFTATSPEVKDVSVTGENGVVLVTLGFSPLTDKTLVFVPSLDQNKKIVWKCASKDIPVRYLPKRCL